MLFLVWDYWAGIFVYFLLFVLDHLDGKLYYRIIIESGKDAVQLNSTVKYRHLSLVEVTIIK